MQLKYGLILFLILFIYPLCPNYIVGADVLNSDWIGTLDKSYEMAWQQDNSKQYNSYGTEFFLEYTYLNKNNKNYPTYCVEYYLKGPDNDSKYGKIKISDMQLPQSVSNGLIYILKNGYPNVERPFNTADAAEAYYATCAAVHIWTMYYDIDEIAGNDLGWFQHKDGFVMNKSAINKYITDYSTKSTSSGWHIIRADNNASSKRTWVAAMKLLQGAIDAETLNPCITIKESKEAYFTEEYLVYEFRIDSNLCENIRLNIDAKIEDIKYEYINERDYTIAIVSIPKDRIKASQVFSVYALADVKGVNDPENYFYLYHLTGTYQSMIYVDSDVSRTINSNKLKLIIPKMKAQVYYDLNYSGVNYIRGGDFKNKRITSYNGDLSYKITGDVDYYIYGGDSSHYCLNMTYKNPGDINNCIYFNTLLPSSSDEGFKTKPIRLLTFSCWMKADQDTKLNLCFGKSETIYEINIKKSDEWQFINLRIIKNESENNYLYLYPTNSSIIDIYNPQLEDGSLFTNYSVENSPKADPICTEHDIGSIYNSIYNGKEPTRENYVFLGWNTQKNGKGQYVDSTQIAVSGDIVLYAIWTQKPVYNVYLHFGTNGGEYIVINDWISVGVEGTYIMQVDNHSTVDLSGVSAYMNGWEYIGWTYEFGLNENPVQHIVDEVYIDGSDVHLYANYKKSYRIFYHYYDELSKTEEIISSVENTTYNNYKLYAVTPLPAYDSKTISIPKVKNYDLKGWSINENEFVNVEYNPGEWIDFCENEHYYAVYEKNISVEFYDNNSEVINYSNHIDDSGLHEKYDLSVAMNSKGKIKQAMFTLPENVCKLQDYDFYGWSDKSGFDGSILYYSTDTNKQIKTEDSMRFYALYEKSRSVIFIDYDFSKKKSHVERTLNAYTYMNYKSKEYCPIIKAPNCCICHEGWNFDGWSKTIEGNDRLKYMTGDEIIVDNDMILYASYKGNLDINCHSLINNNGVPDKIVNTINVQCSMNSNGITNISEVHLPKINDVVINNKSWIARGYSDISDSSVVVTHIDDDKYLFDKSTDLYAVYYNNINIKFIDFDEEKQETVNFKEDYMRFLTCDMLIKPVSIKFPTCISSEYHMNSGWNNDADSIDKIMYYAGDVIDIYEDSTFYGIYMDTYILTLNDLSNDIFRTTKHTSESYINHTGIKYSKGVVIPYQGDDNTKFKPSNYWNTDDGFEMEYFSGEKIYPDKNMILNSVYLKEIKVIFDSNGGIFNNGNTEIIKTDTLKYNVKGNTKLPFFVSEETPVKNAFQFTETWNTNSNGSGKEYFHGEAIMTEDDLRLYAIWKKALKPRINVIDRYFFVGDVIDYDKIINKIITINPYNIPGDEIKIVKINDVDISDIKKSDIPAYIDTSKPCKYKISVDYIVKNETIHAEFDLYVVEYQYKPDRLRYVSDYYMDTLDDESKWRYGELSGILSETLSRQNDDAEYIYQIKKRE